MGMIHKIFSSTRNLQSQNSAVLHLNELQGTAEEAHDFMDELQAQGHHLNGWLFETEEQRAEYERVQQERQQQEARPWPEGKRYKNRWGRS